MGGNGLKARWQSGPISVTNVQGHRRDRLSEITEVICWTTRGKERLDAPLVAKNREFGSVSGSWRANQNLQGELQKLAIHGTSASLAMAEPLGCGA